MVHAEELLLLIIQAQLALLAYFADVVHLLLLQLVLLLQIVLKLIIVAF